MTKALLFNASGESFDIGLGLIVFIIDNNLTIVVYSAIHTGCGSTYPKVKACTVFPEWTNVHISRIVCVDIFIKVCKYLSLEGIKACIKKSIDPSLTMCSRKLLHIAFREVFCISTSWCSPANVLFIYMTFTWIEKFVPNPVFTP